MSVTSIIHTYNRPVLLSPLVKHEEVYQVVGQSVWWKTKNSASMAIENMRVKCCGSG